VVLAMVYLNTAFSLLILPLPRLVPFSQALILPFPRASPPFLYPGPPSYGLVLLAYLPFSSQPIPSNPATQPVNPKPLLPHQLPSSADRALIRGGHFRSAFTGGMEDSPAGERDLSGVSANSGLVLWMWTGKGWDDG